MPAYVVQQPGLPCWMSTRAEIKLTHVTHLFLPESSPIPLLDHLLMYLNFIRRSFFSFQNENELEKVSWINDGSARGGSVACRCAHRHSPNSFQVSSLKRSQPTPSSFFVNPNNFDLWIQAAFASQAAAAMQHRRKSPFAAAPPAAKQDPPARRAGAPLSLAGLVVSVFLVATFLYNEDIVIVKPSAGDDFPLTAGARARSSPDLRLLQQAAHHQEEEHRRVGNKKKKEAPPVRLLDAPISPARAGAGVRADKRAAAKTTAPSSSSRSEAAAAVLAQPACDVYRGWWTYDAEGAQAPLYRESECEFLTEQVTCMRNGRRDDSYQRWRWQPSACDLPRFDARLLLERLRNKRLMFVGDSLNRNQWESMVCLVQSAIPSREHKTLAKFVGGNGSLNVFTAHEYNATVEFYWAPFLVQSNSDDPQVHSVRDRIIAWRSIAKHARHWRGAHYLVFNTYIWWLNTFEMKVLKNARVSSKYTLVDRPIAYREVLKTWAKWVDRHIDPRKTMVFFVGMSPNHITPEAWGNVGAVKCAMETQPILNRTGPLNIGTDWRLHGVAQRVLRSMRRVPVHLVDITALSEFRKDAHTSVHTLRQGKLLTPEQQADPRAYADCIHWCLPGLPDTWNHFLYAQIASCPGPSSHLFSSCNQSIRM